MGYAVGFAAVLAASVLAARLLARAHWTWHAPRIAIISWQALGLAFGLALIGLPLAIGLAPYGVPAAHGATQLATDLVRGELPAGLAPARMAAVVIGLAVAGRLLWVTVASLIRALRAQHHHRQLLALVGRPHPAAPGALVLDHPHAAAYCLPGLRPTVVVSAGALSLLDRGELAAVLSHERAHATERHDLVLLPFTALRRALPPTRWLRDASDAVALLVEMRADDRARRQHADACLAAALRRFATAPVAGTPAGALGVADRAVEARVRRLLDQRRPLWARSTVTLAFCTVLASAPLGLLFLGG
jgi:Zn-dependent protease with chaperone function